MCPPGANKANPEATAPKRAATGANAHSTAARGPPRCPGPSTRARAARCGGLTEPPPTRRLSGGRGGRRQRWAGGAGGGCVSPAPLRRSHLPAPPLRGLRHKLMRVGKASICPTPCALCPTAACHSRFSFALHDRREFRTTLAAPDFGAQLRNSLLELLHVPRSWVLVGGREPSQDPLSPTARAVCLRAATANGLSACGDCEWGGCGA